VAHLPGQQGVTEAADRVILPDHLALKVRAQASEHGKAPQFVL
jgi:hypothetical protein